MMRRIIIRTAIGVSVSIVALLLWSLIYWQNNLDIVIQDIHLNFWETMLFPGGWNLLGATSWAYFFIAIFLGLGAAALYYKGSPAPPKLEEFYENETRQSDFGNSYTQSVKKQREVTPAKPHNKRLTVTGIVGVVLAAVLLGASWVTTFISIPQGSVSFAGGTTIYVDNTDKMPSSMRSLMEHVTKSAAGDECAYRGDVDGINVCIKQRKVTFSWDNRTASAAGATKILQRATESDQSVDLLEETVSSVRRDGKYLWTGIKNGKQASLPVSGIAEWNGTGVAAQACQFKDQFAINKGFDRNNGKNLNNTIANNYPNLIYKMSDAWGYCDLGADKSYDTAEPVIVIPMMKLQSFAHRTTDRFAGVLTIKGSPSGNPVMALDTDIQVGEYPGPVYPATLVKEQRLAVNQFAGINNEWKDYFGYQTSGLTTQQSNPSEYQLASTLDNRVYWVTPLRPSNTTSEHILAYALSPADAATVGQLNPMDFYILNDDPADTRVVDMQRLLTATTNQVNIKQSAFFNKGDAQGSLTEFLPVNDDTWQVYAERNGEVIYRITVKVVGSFVQTELVDLQTQTQTQNVTTLNCGKTLKDLTKDELKQCITSFTDEILRRLP